MTAGAILLVALLVACVNDPTIDPATRAAMTPAHTLYEIQATYNAALAGALVYAEQDRCTELVVVACHDAGVVAALAALDIRIVQAFKVARLATPGADQATAAATLRKLLAEFQSELLAGRVTP
jgi:hypothetical protein